MINLLRAELDKYNIFTSPISDVIQAVADTIPFVTIPDRMKYTIAVSEIMLYASQFRRNIHHWDGGEVPINFVSFVVTGSGRNKDSSVNAARRGFLSGYDTIQNRRKQLAKDTAIRLATEAGVEAPHQWESYKTFYRAPNPLFVAPSTTEGFIQHLNDLDSDGLGAGYMYTGEVGAELSTSQVFVDNIKLISEVYDLGNKEVKVLKARENQSREIRGLPVSAFFAGSPANILYDEVIKKKFKVEFSTKLARRSFFCFIPEAINEAAFDDIDSLIASETSKEDSAIESRLLVSNAVNEFTSYHLPRTGQLLEVDDEVRKLFIVYKRYNSEIADTLSKLHPISVLVRTHLQWKALKLAGALAMFKLNETITIEDYVEAIHFCELLSQDMQNFENELVKEPYELFADYMSSIAIDGKSYVSLHNLRKLGYLQAVGNPVQKMRELVHLAASYDRTAIYTVSDNGIDYEAIKPTSTLNITYKQIDNAPIFRAIESGNPSSIRAAKEQVAATANSDLITEEATFADLAQILSGDFAYSPFRFKDGIRNRENLLPGTKWVVLDIDNSTITASEAHFLLSDINHHVATSSNRDNEFKFRILLELDSVVDVSPKIWKEFYQSIADLLSLKADPVPQSQIFFAYADSHVYSVTDAAPIAVRDHLMLAIEKATSQITAEKPLTKAQMSAALSDPYVTFNYAYECIENGGLNLIRAAHHAYRLGMPKDDIIRLVLDINDYWTQSMPIDRIEQKIISQIERWSY